MKKRKKVKADVAHNLVKLIPFLFENYILKNIFSPKLFKIKLVLSLKHTAMKIYGTYKHLNITYLLVIKILLSAQLCLLDVHQDISCRFIQVLHKIDRATLSRVYSTRLHSIIFNLFFREDLPKRRGELEHNRLHASNNKHVIADVFFARRCSHVCHTTQTCVTIL